MTVFNTVKSAIDKRARYNRTVAALQNMPLQTAIDLGLFKDDAEKTARRAVYG